MWRKKRKLWITGVNIDLNALPLYKIGGVTHINNKKLHSCPQLIHNWGQVYSTQGQPTQPSSHLLLNPVGELSDLVVDRSALRH